MQKLEIGKLQLQEYIYYKKEFGRDKNFISYSNENLVLNTSKVMKFFAENLNIKFENSLNQPTIGGRPWGGNSHYGISKGINSNTLENYKKVLDTEEINFIKSKAGHLREEILSQNTAFLDLSILNEQYLNDLYYQKKYFYDKEKISMYYSLVNYGGRKINVSKVSKLSILALIFSAYVYIYNLPRRIKLKFFPGKGKQNYT